MSKHYAEPEKQQAMWRMRAAYWINKATREKAHVHALATTYIHTHTHTRKFVILIAFPRQQWFREGASLLRYAYIACLVLLLFILALIRRIIGYVWDCFKTRA